VAIALVSGAVDAAANVCYVLATRAGLFGLAVVITSLYPGMTVLLARLLLGERMRWLQRAGLLLAAVGVVLLTVLVGTFLFVLEDQPAYLEVKLLGIGQVIDVAQRLVLPGRLHDELAVTQDPADRGTLEAHVRHLGERHHVHFLGDQSGREQHPLRRDDEVGLRPLENLHEQPDEEQPPQDPDDEDDRAAAVRHRVGQPARDGQPDQDLEDGPDQYRGMLVNRDDLTLMGQEVPIY